MITATAKIEPPTPTNYIYLDLPENIVWVAKKDGTYIVNKKHIEKSK